MEDEDAATVYLLWLCTDNTKWNTLIVPNETGFETGGYLIEGGVEMKFYTIKLPKLLGGVVKAVLNTFSKN